MCGVHDPIRDEANELDPNFQRSGWEDHVVDTRRTHKQMQALPNQWNPVVSRRKGCQSERSLGLRGFCRKTRRFGTEQELVLIVRRSTDQVVRDVQGDVPSQAMKLFTEVHQEVCILTKAVTERHSEETKKRQSRTEMKNAALRL